MFESGKLILSKSRNFVGKGYSCDGMIKICTNDNFYKIASNSSYMCDSNSLSLWHNRLGHVSLSTIKRIVKCGMIACDAKEFEICEICVKSKMIKKPFHNVERPSNLLDLIHSDLCELNDMLTRGGNRYFLTFINYCSRFTYVFLLKNKSETFNAFKVYKAKV